MLQYLLEINFFNVFSLEMNDLLVSMSAEKAALLHTQ